VGIIGTGNGAFGKWMAAVLGCGSLNNDGAFGAFGAA
jgi:hypothetical protein